MEIKKMRRAKSLFSLCLLAWIACLAQADHKIVQLNENNWERMLTGNWVVVFYTSQGQSANNLDPLWAQLSSSKLSQNTQIGKIDVKDVELSEKLKTVGSPLIYYIRDGVFCQYKYSQDGESITRFVNSELWITEKPILSLDDSDPNAPFFTQISPLFDVSTRTRLSRSAKTSRETKETETARIKVSSPLVYTAPGWMNDPNGLVFVDGIYHLFYQYNANSTTMANISWGHAIGKDLVSWQDKGVAIPYDAEDQVMAFTGSAVYDKQNSCGLGDRWNPPLVAIYTSFFSKDVTLPDGTNITQGTQAQSVAYSTDKGNNWQFYEGNPVIRKPPGKYSGEFKDFRDPKVFWYEPQKKWVMVAVLSRIKLAIFFSSNNLKRWSFMSVFGTPVSPDGVWECPDLFELTVESENVKKWILIISTNPGGMYGGSGMHYYVGQFDGFGFKEDEKTNSTAQIKWLDFGSDFYAGNSWNNADRRYLIGWVNNWDYAQKITNVWSGGQSIVREVGLARINNKLKLVQKPVRNLGRYRQGPVKYSADLAERGIEILRNKAYEFEVQLKNMSKGFNVIMSNDKNVTEAEIKYEASKKLLIVRKLNINPSSNSSYVEHSTAFQPNASETLRVFVDDYTLTLFNTAGDIVFTELLISNATQRRDIRLSPENKANVTVTRWLIANEALASSGISVTHSVSLLIAVVTASVLRK